MVDLGLLAGFYLLTAAGVTVGFHRLFVHRSFETITPIKVTLAALKTLKLEFDDVAEPCDPDEAEGDAA